MKEYKTAEWQWWDYKKKRAVPLDNMSVDELKQALCFTMDTLENIESNLVDACAMMRSWRDGEMIRTVSK